MHVIYENIHKRVFCSEVLAKAKAEGFMKATRLILWTQLYPRLINHLRTHPYIRTNGSLLENQVRRRTGNKVRQVTYGSPHPRWRTRAPRRVRLGPSSTCLLTQPTSRTPTSRNGKHSKPLSLFRRICSARSRGSRWRTQRSRPRGARRRQSFGTAN